jgi:hypothetical protein
MWLAACGARPRAIIARAQCTPGQSPHQPVPRHPATIALDRSARVYLRRRAYRRRVRAGIGARHHGLARSHPS